MKPQEIPQTTRKWWLPSIEAILVAMLLIGACAAANLLSNFEFLWHEQLQTKLTEAIERAIDRNSLFARFPDSTIEPAVIERWGWPYIYEVRVENDHAERILDALGCCGEEHKKELHSRSWLIAGLNVVASILLIGSTYGIVHLISNCRRRGVLIGLCACLLVGTAALFTATFDSRAEFALQSIRAILCLGFVSAITLFGMFVWWAFCGFMVRPKPQVESFVYVRRFIAVALIACLLASIFVWRQAEFQTELEKAAVADWQDAGTIKFHPALLPSAIAQRYPRVRSLELNQLGNGNMPKGVAPFANFYWLQELILTNWHAADFSPLAKLKRLRALTLDGSNINDLTPLEKLKLLETLSLQNCQVSDLKPLSNLRRLEQLDLSETQVSDVAPLRTLHNLKDLDISRTRVADISPLIELVNLQSLKCYNNQLSSFRGLDEAQSLKSLYGSHCPINDLQSLANARRLEILDLSNTSVSDLTPLREHLQLTTLSLQETAVVDISPLSKLVSLETVLLENCGVEEITALNGHQSLAILDIRGTKVTDLTPLFHAKKLEQVHLSKQFADDPQVDILRRRLPHFVAHIDNTPLETSSDTQQE